MNLQTAIQTLGRFTNTVIITPKKTFFTDNESTFFGAIEVDTDLTFGLYDDVNNFSKLLGLFEEEPKVSINDGVLTLVEGENELNFVTSNMELIKRNDINLEDQLEKTLQAPKVMKTRLTKLGLSKLKNAINGIENSKLVLESKDGKLKFKVKDVSTIQSQSNTFSLEVLDCEALEREFNIYIDGSFVSKLGDLQVQVVYSAKMDSYRVLLISDEIVIVVPSTKIE